MFASMRRKRREPEFANEGDAASTVFVNGSIVGDDGWAQLAPFGDFRGIMRLRQADGTVRQEEAVQRLDAEAANAMVRAFKSPVGRLKRWLRGVPVYLGHPDAPGIGSRYPDSGVKGMIADLEVRETGLFARPVFNNDGASLLEGRSGLHFSGRWTAQLVAEDGGRKIFRPDVLMSVGLTDNPNLPVEALNDDGRTAPDPMNLTAILAALKKYGIELAETATEADIVGAIDRLGTAAASVPALTNERDTARTEAANERTARTTVETALTQANAARATVESERDGLRTAFQNEREARITGAIAAARKATRISTDAEAAEWKTKLAGDFSNELPRLEALAPKVKTTSQVDPAARRAEIANAGDRMARVQQAVAEQMAKGLNYDQAYAAVQREQPQLFAAMVTPASA